MEFEDQLSELLPADLPMRDAVIGKAARHLALIVDVNQHMNLTRIVEPREAVIKHVLDSVIPWQLFAEAKRVLDAGTGPGFPGLPLAFALPAVPFILTDSTQKKARFVESAIEELGVGNVEVAGERAEDLLRRQRVEVITARALAPLSRALGLFGPALQRGSRLLLYKGPDVEKEIVETESDALRRHIRVRVVMRYELPDGLGSRCIVEAGDYATVGVPR